MSNNPETTNVLKSTALRRKKIALEKEKEKPVVSPDRVSEKEKPVVSPDRVSEKEKPVVSPEPVSQKEVLPVSKESKSSKESIEKEWKSIEQKWTSLKTQSRKKNQTKETNKDAAQRILNSAASAPPTSSSAASSSSNTPMGNLITDMLRSFFPEPTLHVDPLDSFFEPTPPRSMFARSSMYPYSQSSLELLRSRLHQDQARMSQSVETLVNQIQDVSLRFSQPSRIRGSEGKTLISGLKPTDENTACPICLETAKETTETNLWRQFPCCKNFIHLECAKSALSKDMRCPMCRKETE